LKGYLYSHHDLASFEKVINAMRDTSTNEFKEMFNDL
jgi:hypothetical protein